MYYNWLYSGSERTLDCKLHWHLKFLSHVLLQMCNFIYHYLGCTSVYLPLSYPLRFLIILQRQHFLFDSFKLIFLFREGTEEFLERLHLTDLVDIVVCGDDAQSKSKPDPHNARYKLRQQVWPPDKRSTIWLFGKL